MYLLEAKKKAEREAAKAEARKKREDAKRRVLEKQSAAKDDAQRRLKDAQQQQEHRERQRREAAAEEERQLKAAMERSKATAKAEQDRRAAELAKQQEDEDRRLQEALRQEKQARQARAQRQQLAQRQAASKSAAPTPPASVAATQPSSSSSSKLDKASSEMHQAWRDAKVKCKYVGTFEVGEGNIDRQAVKSGILVMKDYIEGARPATLVICLEGIKVVDSDSGKVAMAHALNRVSMCSVDVNHSLFGFVAKNPRSKMRYCHVFETSSPKHAQTTHSLVSKAFKLAFVRKKSVRKPGERHVSPPPAGPANPKSEPPSTPAPPPSLPQVPTPATAATTKPPRSITDTAPPQLSPTREWARENPLQQDAALDASLSELALQPPPTPSIPSPLSEPEVVDPLQEVSWYQPGLPRDIAMEVLQQSHNGAFLVRDSQSQPGNFALTLKSNGAMHHFIIRNTPVGYMMGTEVDGEKPFADLISLVHSHTRHRGILPCILEMDSVNVTEDGAEEEGGDDDESFIDPDYQEVRNLRERRRQQRQ
eukprot:m.359836 g.359836  ORF g.359836 m.359836 type:complete len:537 (+) comp18764_c0_seq1:413-2023(+)